MLFVGHKDKFTITHTVKT